jgi:hypothetical protein
MPGNGFCLRQYVGEVMVAARCAWIGHAQQTMWNRLYISTCTVYLVPYCAQGAQTRREGDLVIFSNIAPGPKVVGF